MNKWVRVPGPGQFRGEGEWKPLDEVAKGYKMEPEEVWDKLRQTAFLPTHIGDKPPTS